MAAITIAESTLRWNAEGDKLKIITPDTADSNDTIDITAIMKGRKVTRLSCWDTTTGDEEGATYNISTDVITIDAAGGTTDHVYVINVDFTLMRED